MDMKTICANCLKHLRGEVTAARISHGICNDCLRVLYPEFAEEIIQELRKETVS